MDSATKKMFEYKVKNTPNENLVSIVYEILICYLNDALKCDFDENIRRADLCLDTLIKSVNLDVEPSNELLSIFSFYKTQFVKARIKEDSKIIKDAIPVFEKFLHTYKMVEQKMNEYYNKYVLYDKRGHIIC